MRPTTFLSLADPKSARQRKASVGARARATDFQISLPETGIPDTTFTMVDALKHVIDGKNGIYCRGIIDPSTRLPDRQRLGVHDRLDETKPKNRSNRRLCFAVVARHGFGDPDADDGCLFCPQFLSAQNGELLARSQLRGFGHRANIRIHAVLKSLQVDRLSGKDIIAGL
jgi:hypothetical protein